MYAVVGSFFCFSSLFLAAFFRTTLDCRCRWKTSSDPVWRGTLCRGHPWCANHFAMLRLRVPEPCGYLVEGRAYYQPDRLVPTRTRSLAGDHAGHHANPRSVHLPGLQWKRTGSVVDLDAACSWSSPAAEFRRPAICHLPDSAAAVATTDFDAFALDSHHYALVYHRAQGVHW